MNRLASLLATLLIFSILCWGIGAFIFVERVTDWMAPAHPKADAIVVLTGGESRVKAAIALLKEEKGKRLLISGVHPDTQPGSLIQILGTSAEALFACCVDLDHKAVDTETNALETARWAKINGFSSLIVVTASYHMPRTMVELSRRMPETYLLPFPVVPASLKDATWWKQPDLVGLVLGEYNKYLVSLLRAQLSGHA